MTELRGFLDARLRFCGLGHCGGCLTVAQPGMRSMIPVPWGCDGQTEAVSAVLSLSLGKPEGLGQDVSAARAAGASIVEELYLTIFVVCN